MRKFEVNKGKGKMLQLYNNNTNNDNNNNNIECVYLCVQVPRETRKGCQIVRFLCNWGYKLLCAA